MESKMEFRRGFSVEKIEDKRIDKAGEEDVQNVRSISLKVKGITVTIVGDPLELSEFLSGDSVELVINSTQTKLPVEEED